MRVKEEPFEYRETPLLPGEKVDAIFAVLDEIKTVVMATNPRHPWVCLDRSKRQLAVTAASSKLEGVSDKEKTFFYGYLERTCPGDENELTFTIDEQTFRLVLKRACVIADQDTDHVPFWIQGGGPDVPVDLDQLSTEVKGFLIAEFAPKLCRWL